MTIFWNLRFDRSIPVKNSVAHFLRACYNGCMKRKLVLIAIVIALLALVLVACMPPRPALTYRDDVVARYCDGISVTQSFGPPQGATEYTDTARVEQTVYVDNRVIGEHAFGLYLPAGETLSVSYPADAQKAGHAVILRSLDGTRQDRYVCTGESMQISASFGTGASVLFDVAQTEGQFSAFRVVLRGGVLTPMYRMGVESEEKFLQSASVGRALVDTGNIRFFFAAEDRSAIVQQDLYEACRWWRSAIEQLNAITGLGSAIGDYAPITVEVRDSASQCVYDTQSGVVTIPASAFVRAMQPQSLQSNQTVDIMRAVCGLRIEQSEGFVKDWEVDSIVRTVAEVIAIELTDDTWDGYAVQERSSRSAERLQQTLDGQWKSDPDRLRGFISNLMYSFGRASTLELLEAYRSSDASIGADGILRVASDVLQRDLRAYALLFDIQPSEETIAYMQRYEPYLPVQNRYTYGASEMSAISGTKAYLNRPIEFDFQSAIVAEHPENWQVVSVEGTQELWTRLEDGKYRYTPSADHLYDTYRLNLSDGTHTVTLYGAITVDVHSVTYEVYDNVSYRDIDTAIKAVREGDITPSTVTAFPTVNTPAYSDSDVIENEYSFSVLRGSMQVPQDGKYKIYLKNRGQCRVMFGVKDYMYELFDNTLTVNVFTEELCEEIALEKGIVYQFEIYILNVTGSQRGGLGLRVPGNTVIAPAVPQLAGPYLYSPGMEESKEQNYQAPYHAIRGYDAHLAEYEEFTSDQWKVQITPDHSTQGNTPQAIVDKNADTVYVSTQPSQRFELNIDMLTALQPEFIGLLCAADSTNAAAVQCTVQLSSDGQNYVTVAQQEMQYPLTEFALTDAHGRYLKVVMESDTPFRISVRGISVGKSLRESTIIPNTSTKLEYQGEWRECSDYAAINGIVTENNDRNCALSLNFYGSEIALYATKAEKYGVARIYLDGKDMGIVDLHASTTLCSQRVFYQNVGEGFHKLRVVAVDEDLINIDYFAYVPSPAVDPPPETKNLYFILIIPGIALVVGIVAVCLDIADKRKRDLKYSRPTSIQDAAQPPAEGEESASDSE